MFHNLWLHHFEIYGKNIELACYEKRKAEIERLFNIL